MTQRQQRLIQGHIGHFGTSQPVRLFRAPGRVNLIGEHTDYNDGFVLPVALDRDTQLAASLRTDRKVRLHAMDLGESVVFDLDHIEALQPEGWGRYPYGVAAVLLEEGVTLRGVDAVVQGTVPIGAGLSSSAALEVAIATMFLALSEAEIAAPALARLCQRAENEYAGVNCGIMDQFISCLARPRSALFLDCRSLAYETIPFDAPEYALVIANTNRPRDLVKSAYNERRQECEEGARLLGLAALRDATPAQFEASKDRLPETIARRCQHVVYEDDRVLRSVEALKEQDFLTLGALMNASHDSLRDLYEVSCTELDSLVEIARQCPGVVGSRMTGAGFGGCTVSLVRADAVNTLEAAIRKDYPKVTPYQPDVYVCQPSGGAGEILV